MRNDRRPGVPALRSLQAFEALGRCGSVTAAAADLGLTPGAVSQQLRKLEGELGMPLVERQGRGLRLTTWGKLYFDEIAAAFERMRRAQAVVTRARTQEESLVVSCLPSIASKWLARRLFDWQASHPGAQVRLIGTDTEPSFGSDSVDFRISYGARRRRFEHWAELFTDFVTPVCAPALLRRQHIEFLRICSSFASSRSNGTPSIVHPLIGPPGRRISARIGRRRAATSLSTSRARRSTPPSRGTAARSPRSP